MVVEFDRTQATQLRFPRYGNANPDHIRNPFWELMIRQRRNAHWARRLFRFPKIDRDAMKRLYYTSAWREYADGPVFCFQRFGRSVTQLADGRIVSIGGEHEDSYDPDFCIYNDVVVEDPNGEITIYGYPRDTFPPTDFHTATLVGANIYLIGSLGYANLREPGETPVYTLDTEVFSIRPLPTEGDAPGWISRHTAEYDRSLNAIRVSGGQIATEDGKLPANTREFLLDLSNRTWRSSSAEHLP